MLISTKKIEMINFCVKSEILLALPKNTLFLLKTFVLLSLHTLTQISKRKKKENENVVNSKKCFIHCFRYCRHLVKNIDNNNSICPLSICLSPQDENTN